MKSITLKVDGMSCGHCVSSVEGALQSIGASGKVDLGTKTVSIEFDDTAINLDSIKAAIEEQGYAVED